MTAREPGTGPRAGAGLHPGDVFGLLLLRLGLGGVLVWFGAAELHNPGAWAVFVPKMFDPILAPLMFVHAAVLLVTGALLVAGMFHRLAAWLGGLILLAILGALAMNGSIDSVFVRDVGLACAAFALALSPTTRSLPGVDTWLAGRPSRIYAVPAVSYGIVLAAIVGVLAVTAVPSNGASAAALNNLGGMGGLSTLGGPSVGGAAAGPAGGASLAGGSAITGVAAAGSAAGTCSSSSTASAGTCTQSSKGGATGSSATASTGGLGTIGAVAPSRSGN